MKVADPMIRVLIIDAYTVLRHGLRLILQTDSHLTVVGDAGTCTDALHQLSILTPQVILIDPNLPDIAGPEALRQLQAAAPETEFVVLTTFNHSDAILAAFKAGAKGYLLKDVSGQEVIQTIHQVAKGHTVLPPDLTHCLLTGMASPSPEDLTTREQDVLYCLTQGLGNKEIAAELNISENTVKTHVRRILCKLHLRSRTEAVAYALQSGLVAASGQLYAEPVS